MNTAARIKTGAATVSGPGVDRTMPEGPACAMSFAITCAQRSSTAATFYVRDDMGEVVARVERLDGGQTLIFGALMLAAERRKEQEERPAFVPTA